MQLNKDRPHLQFLLTVTASSVLFVINAQASVVCANGNTGMALDGGFGPSASIPAAAGFGGSTAPLPAGCNSSTFIKLKGGFAWTYNGSGNAVGGDRVDWSKSWINGFGYGEIFLDPDDLGGLVTPTLPVSGISLSITGAELSPTQAHFMVDWSGTDPGDAQRLRWYSYTGTIPPGFIGDNTELPSWTSLSTLLRQDLRVGPWSESLSVDLTGVDVSTIILAVNGVATSTAVPEPSEFVPSVLMLLLGTVSMLHKRAFQLRQ
jgi:hypothetical protein